MNVVELLEEADGVVKVVLEGKITITVVADGDTCDVEVTADVSLTSSIDGEAEGLYAFIAAEVVGRAICSGWTDTLCASKNLIKGLNKAMTYQQYTSDTFNRKLCFVL